MIQSELSHMAGAVHDSTINIIVVIIIINIIIIILVIIILGWRSLSALLP